MAKSKRMKRTSNKALNALDRLACVVLGPALFCAVLKVAFGLFGPLSFISTRVCVVLGAMLFIASLLGDIALAVAWWREAAESGWRLSKTLKMVVCDVLAAAIATAESCWRWLVAD